jgi:hypothetical protein
MELFSNVSFETAEYWDLVDDAAYSSAYARTGSQSMRLSKIWAFGPSNPRFQGVVNTHPGYKHSFSIWYNPFELVVVPDNRFSLSLYFIDQYGGADEIERIFIDPPWLDQWYEFEVDQWITQNHTETIGYNLIGSNPDPGGLYNAKLYLDDASMEGPEPQELLIMRSTAISFMEKLKALMETLDPNIGSIFVTQKRWPSTTKFGEDAQLKISVAGLFDATEFVGKNVSRFWVMSPFISPTAMTNDSIEYKVAISINVFYSRLEDDTQEEALQKALIEVIGAVGEKNAELVTLNTGSQYMGYLNEMPEMTLPIQGAVLDEGGIHGHAAQLKVTYFEEVPRSL